MKKNNLVPNKGLSISQAQSISNLCNQRASEITKKLMGVNNYSKFIHINGKNRNIKIGVPIPQNTVDLLNEKSRLFACQAFLMENIKAKSFLLEKVKNESPDFSSVTMPKEPLFIDSYEYFETNVDEQWGWDQLTSSEINEYYEAEAYAAHIGQFIHNDSILNNLRKELNNIPSIEWITIKDGEKTPVDIHVHHSSEELLELHEKLARIHRKYEQRVNYFKAKVKNLVTSENSRIASLNNNINNEINTNNDLLRNEYNDKYSKAIDLKRKIQTEFEKKRQEKISNIASMRIDVDPRFQPVIDMFLNELNDNDD